MVFALQGSLLLLLHLPSSPPPVLQLRFLLAIGFFHALDALLIADQAALLLEGQEGLIFGPSDGDDLSGGTRLEERGIHEFDGMVHLGFEKRTNVLYSVCEANYAGLLAAQGNFHKALRRASICAIGYHFEAGEHAKLVLRIEELQTLRCALKLVLEFGDGDHQSLVKPPEEMVLQVRFLFFLPLMTAIVIGKLLLVQLLFNQFQNLD